MKRHLLSLLLVAATVVGLLFTLGGCAATDRNVHHDIEDYLLSYDIGDKDDFTILQLTDIHVANKDDRARQYAFLRETIERSGADMIVVTGDLFTFADKQCAKELLTFLDSFGLPWTLTFGNHDEQCYFSIDWLTGYLNSFGSHCLFRDLPDDDVYGNANFAINLQKNGGLFAQVILMDSNRYHYGNYIGYDYIKENQIEWYKTLVDYTTEQNGGTPVNSLLYFHIPLPEWDDAYADYENGGETVLVRGTKNEKSCPPDYNSGFFDVILEKNSTRAINVGHDHLNDCVLKYKGVYLCYGIHSTDRIYFQEDLLGGRLLTISSDGSITFGDITHSYD